MVPMELPGDSVPPLIVVLPSVPVPPSVAPLLIVVSDDVTIEPFTISVPALTVVAPKYVFVPESVNAPVPDLVKLPLPLITPANVVLLLSLPAVSAAEPSVTLP